MDTRQEHRDLMLSWSKRAPDGPGRFIADGPLDWGGWESAKPRVLFLMKEAYDKKLEEGEFLDEEYQGSHLSDHWTLPSLMNANIETNWLPSTWKNLFLWARAMLDFNPHLPPCDDILENDPKRFELLKSCAFVNIKKYKGKSKSDPTDLKAHLLEGGEERNADLLRRQILLLKPDIVICCAVFATVQEAFQGQPPLEGKPSRSIWDVHQYGGTVWFDYWHPAWTQASRFLLLQGLHAMRVRFEAKFGRIAPDATAPKERREV